MKVVAFGKYVLFSQEPQDVSDKAKKAAQELRRKLILAGNFIRMVQAENGHGLPKFRVYHKQGKGPNISWRA